MTREPRPPVIIIGMHRSGTSVLTKILEELGLFAGWRQDPNREATFFLLLNDWLLRQSGGSWDHPEAARDLLRSDELSALATDHLRFSLRTPRAIGYLGLGKFLRYRSIERLDIPWGWKDPRNTFTLPLWLNVFPEARVLHIHRHGVDVATSLLKRQEQSVARARRVYRRRKLIYAFARKRLGFSDSPRCWSLEGAFSLWESYMNEARRHVKELGDRALEIRYEGLLHDPLETLRGVAPFCGLDATDAAIERATRSLRPERAGSFLSDSELRGFAQEVAERLAAARPAERSSEPAAVAEVSRDCGEGPSMVKCSGVERTGALRRAP